jgi:hypothetical protein
MDDLRGLVANAGEDRNSANMPRVFSDKMSVLEWDSDSACDACLGSPAFSWSRPCVDVFHFSSYSPIVPYLFVQRNIINVHFRIEQAPFFISDEMTMQP